MRGFVAYTNFVLRKCKRKGGDIVSMLLPLVVNSPNCDTSEFTFAFGVLYARGPPPIRIGQSNDNRHFIGAASACGRFDSGFVLNRCANDVPCFP